MAKINITASLGTNTGKVAGDIRMGRPKTILLTRGKEFTEAELADSESLQAAIQAAINLDRDDPNKIFIIDGIREAEDNTGDPQEGTLGDGYSEIINEAAPKYTLRNTKGVAEQQSYVAFNGSTMPGFIIDDKGVFWYSGTTTGGGEGFDIASWYATPPRFGNTGNINVNLIKVAFADVDQFKSNVGALKLDFTGAELDNLVDVELRSVAAVAGMVVTVGVFNKYAGTSVYSKFKAGLSQTGAWEFVNLATGVASAPASVAASDSTPDKNGGFGGFTVTKAAGSGKFLLRLKSPAALAGLATPVKGIEGVAVKVEFA